MTKQYVDAESSERGVALVSTLLIMALLIVLALGISLTSVTELGVSSAYTSQTRAFEAAEAGLNHATSLISNFQGNDFTCLLALRGQTSAGSVAFPSNFFANSVFDPKFAAASSNTYFYNAFSAFNVPGPSANPNFAAGCVPIPPGGLALIDASGNPTGAYYRVALIDDEALTDSTPPPNPSVPNFKPGASWREATTPPSPLSPCWSGPTPSAGDPRYDINNRVVLYSTGTYANTSVTLEGWAGFLPYPALVAQGDITAWGNSSINGLYGSVHSNGSLAVGASAYIAQSATATGTYSQSGSANVGGFSGGGQPAMVIPQFVTNAPITSGGPNTTPRIQDYLIQQADTILIDPGFAQGASATNPNAADAATQRLNNLAARLNVPYTVLQAAIGTNSSAAAVSITRAANGVAVATSVIPDGSGLLQGWQYSGGNWGIPPGSASTSPANGHTVYVVGVDNFGSNTPNGGNVKLTGNIGSGGTPLQVTAFATGSFDIAGTPNVISNLRGFRTPELPPFAKIDMLFCAVEDLKINGDVNGGLVFNGVCYCGEQFNLSGNGIFNGQVVSKSDTDIPGSPVSANAITGHFDLTLNNGNMVGMVKLISWRQIKE